MNTKQLFITLLCVASLLSLPACWCKKNKCCTKNESVEVVENRSTNTENDMMVAHEDFDINDQEEITIALEEEKQTSSTLKF